MGLGKGGASGQTGPLPSCAEVAGISHRLLSSHTASSTLASLSSRSRAHASWQRRGPNVPSFWRIGVAKQLRPQDKDWGGWSPGTTSRSMHGEGVGSQSTGGVPLSKSQMLGPWGQWGVEVGGGMEGQDGSAGLPGIRGYKRRVWGIPLASPAGGSCSGAGAGPRQRPGLDTPC